MRVICHIATAHADPIANSIGIQHLTRLGNMLRRYHPQSELEMDIMAHYLKVRCEPKADVSYCETMSIFLVPLRVFCSL